MLVVLLSDFFVKIIINVFGVYFGDVLNIFVFIIWRDCFNLYFLFVGISFLRLCLRIFEF